jgi:putative ABC transport system substrate-binding protein
MRRREFIMMLGGAAAWPLAARAQQPAKLAHIGFLDLGPASARASRVEALRGGLRQLGYIEGRDLVFVFRWADSIERVPELAAELVRINVDIIVGTSSTMVEAARQATQSIPIVFFAHADPVGIGHVASLARPGGNITGLSMLLTEMVTKELEILKELVPDATRLGVLWNPTTPSHAVAIKAVEAAGQRLGVQLRLVPLVSVEDIDGAFASLTGEKVGGFLDVISPLTFSQRVRLAEAALKHRLPGMYGSKENVAAGGLVSYGADVADLARRAAVYIDKILRGAKPADLPVEQASKYQLFINLNTAKAIGLEVPASLLARAVEVIA